MKRESGFFYKSVKKFHALLYTLKDDVTYIPEKDDIAREVKLITLSTWCIALTIGWIICRCKIGDVTFLDDHDLTRFVENVSPRTGKWVINRSRWKMFDNGRIAVPFRFTRYLSATSGQCSIAHCTGPFGERSSNAIRASMLGYIKSALFLDAFSTRIRFSRARNFYRPLLGNHGLISHPGLARPSGSLDSRNGRVTGYLPMSLPQIPTFSPRWKFDFRHEASICSPFEISFMYLAV